jgi:hypothetical protein
MMRQGKTESVFSLCLSGRIAALETQPKYGGYPPPKIIIKQPAVNWRTSPTRSVSPSGEESPKYMAVSPPYCPMPSPTKLSSPDSPSVDSSTRKPEDGPPSKKTKLEKQREKRKHKDQDRQQQPSGSRGATKPIPKGMKLGTVGKIEAARKWYADNKKCWHCGKDFHGIKCKNDAALPANIRREIEDLVLVPK